MSDRIAEIKARLAADDHWLGACLDDISYLLEHIESLAQHLDMFCKCPSHGPSLIQFPDGEFDE